jgi:hypothetical protein
MRIPANHNHLADCHCYQLVAPKEGACQSQRPLVDGQAKGRRNVGGTERVNRALSLALMPGGSCLTIRESSHKGS